MTVGFDIDHTSFAVHDALSWATRLRRELGAVPIAGETVGEFRYLLLYVGDADSGGRLELLEPTGLGFLEDFLSTHGEGAHHLTFTVPDLYETVRRVRALGLKVIGENYDNSSWREAFIVPDSLHRTVIQLAQSDQVYPEPRDLLATEVRDLSSFPSSKGATEPLWWTSIWATPAVGRTQLGATCVTSTDLAMSRRLFVDVLGAQEESSGGSLDLTWPNGSLRVQAGDAPGITAVNVIGGPIEGLSIGACDIGTCDIGTCDIGPSGRN